MSSQQVDKLNAMAAVDDKGVGRYQGKQRLGDSPSDASILKVAALRTQRALQ